MELNYDFIDISKMGVYLEEFEKFKNYTLSSLYTILGNIFFQIQSYGQYNAALMIRMDFREKANEKLKEIRIILKDTLSFTHLKSKNITLVILTEILEQLRYDYGLAVLLAIFLLRVFDIKLLDWIHSDIESIEPYLDDLEYSGY